jgi:simple sugar transport system permease protein
MVRKYSESIILGLVLAGSFLLMWTLNGNNFIQPDNLQSMAFQLRTKSSLAMMITMLTSGINLSIISSANLTGIVIAMILTSGSA